MILKKRKKLIFGFNLLYIILIMILGFHSDHINLQAQKNKTFINATTSGINDPFLDKDLNCLILIYNTSLHNFSIVKSDLLKSYSEKSIIISADYSDLSIIFQRYNPRRAPPVAV